MGSSVVIPTLTSAQLYEAVVRISEALIGAQAPEELAQSLADQLNKFLRFDHLDVVLFKEGSGEVEWQVWGKGPLPFSTVPVEELQLWQVHDSQEPLYISDWNNDDRLPRLRELAAERSIPLGSILRVPLTTAHRRLGTLGIASASQIAYNSEDIGLLRLIARMVALAIAEDLNVGRAKTAQAELQHNNDRLQLLLNLTNRITSNLELRDLLRAIAANIREITRADFAAISLPDQSSGKQKSYALDFPQGRGLLREELLLTPSDPAKRALETLRPVIVNETTPDDFPPELYEIAVGEGVKCACFIPLANRGRALGVLVIGRTTEGSFTPADVAFLSQAAGQIAIAVENALAYEEISRLKDKLAQEKLYLEEEIRSEMGFEEIIGNSAALKHVLQLVETVAPSDSTVLLLGETGTGKELIARAVHEHSRRKQRTFVKLNCAAIPTGLLESELFGHEKGAFTGAISQKIGRLELADQGTLFLDEVGDIPIEIQPKLLRALQEREFERLGSTHTRKANVRLIAATNRDLEKMIAAREFRSDLYYRLNVFPIRIPSLRERREDIPLLVNFFVQKFSKKMQKKIDSVSSAVMRGLATWDWPGNVRELENFIERAVLLTRGRSLEAPLAELRKAAFADPSLNPQSQQDIARIVKQTIDTLSGKVRGVDYTRKEREQLEEIKRALKESNGRVGGSDGAAARMGINRTTLLARIKKFGIDPKQYA